MDTWKRGLSGRVSFIHIESLKDVPFKAYVMFAIVFGIVGLAWVAPEWRKDAKEAVFGAKPAITGAPAKEPAAEAQPKAAEPKVVTALPTPALPKEEPRVTPYPTPLPGAPEIKSRPQVTAILEAPILKEKREIKTAVRGVEWKLLDYGALYNGPITALNALAKAGIDVTKVESALRQHVRPPIQKDDSVLAVRLAVEELGFSKPALMIDIIKRAEDFGLRPFPAEAIPAAALAYSDKQRYFFATQVAPREYRWRAVIAVGNDGGTASLSYVELHSFFDHDRPFHPKAVFLFSR